MATQIFAMLLPFIKTKGNAVQMIKQSTKRNNLFPLKGIEHTYIPDIEYSYCKHCGYHEDNLMHII